MALVAGTSLGRYEVQAPLGRGGMGEVYLARDPQLGRTVAIKLLPAAFAADPDRLRRFQQEAQTTAALNHPRILAIHDIGRIADQPFIVMEYVRGETLSAFLRRGRPSLARALEIGIEIADALTAAHGARVVHRDLKPANIMVTGDGHIKVLDFGLAKFVWTDASAPTLEGSDGPHTQSGHVLGTPGYMSPEQLLGDRVDERTDVYALGVILFELVTGQRPYGDVFDLLTGGDRTTPLRTAHEIDGAIAPAISAVIARAMARRPADRFQTAAELGAELQRLLLGESSIAVTVDSDAPKVAPKAPRRRGWIHASWLLAGAIAVGVAVIPFVSGPAVTDSVRDRRPVIAVLPLQYLSGDASKAYLGIGIADTLTTSLMRLSSIVVSQSNLPEAEVSTRTLEEIARSLGATMVVRGSIQEAGSLLRVNASLVSLEGTVLWSDGEEARRDELFAMQNRLAESLVSTLRIRVTTAEHQELARAPTQDPDALELYWRGLALLDRPDDGDFDAAVGYFKEATTRDKRFSLAFAALGETYRRRAVRTNDPALMDQAEAAVKQALRLDAERPEVRLALARLYRSMGQPIPAAEEVRQVLALQPNNDNAYRLLGDLLAKSGKPEDALKALRSAADLRPDYWLNQEALGLFFYGNGQLRDAIEAFKRLTQLKPNDANPFQQLGAMYLASGDLAHAKENFQASNKIRENAGSYANLGTIAYYEHRWDDAIREYEAALRLEPTVAAHQGNLGDALQKRGRRTEARAAYLKAIEMGEQALAVNQNDVTTVSRLGVYYAKVGQPAEAKKHANRAAKTKPNDPEVLYLRAVALALIGERDAAVKQLAEAIDRGYAAQRAREDDDLESLRNVPAFQSLIVATKPR